MNNKWTCNSPEAAGIRTGGHREAGWCFLDDPGFCRHSFATDIPDKSQCQIGRNHQADCGFGQRVSSHLLLVLPVPLLPFSAGLWPLVVGPSAAAAGRNGPI